MTIKKQLVSIFSLIAFLSIANVVVLLDWAESSKLNSSIINQAGKQRMLTQRLVSQLLLVPSDPKMLGQAEQTMDEFDQVLNDLRKQAESGSSSSVNTVALVPYLEDVNKQWLKCKALVGRYISGGNFSNDSGLELFASLSKTMKLMNVAVQKMDSNAQTSVDKLILKLELSAAITVVFIAVALLIVFRNILKPLNQLVGFTQRVASSADLTLRIRSKKDNELGIVSRCFDDMLERFARMNNEVIEANQEMTEGISNVKSTSAKSQSLMDGQKREILSLGTAISQMVSAFTSVRDVSEGAASLAHTVREDANKGSDFVKQGVQYSKSLHSKLASAGSHLDLLMRSSDEISEISENIANIAEQTNLLALNAAIEAARAGEQGRGFAVVADEVRVLASRTHVATIEIGKYLEEFVSSLRTSLDSVSEIKEFSDLNIAQAELTLRTNKEILSTIDKLNDLNTQIVTAASEHQLAAGAVTKMMNQINQNSDETNESSKASNEAAADLVSLSSELNIKLCAFKSS